MQALHEQIFFLFYHLFGPSSPASVVTIFFAQWFPYIVVSAAFAYELFVRNEGETFRALWRIYTPPLSVLAITELFKMYFPSPRPFAALDIPPSILVHNPFGSFPSSHTAFFAALGITMFFCNPRLGKYFLWCAAIIGIARIGTGVHWPLDIVAGFFIGTTVAYLVEKISFLLRKGRVTAC